MNLSIICSSHWACFFFVFFHTRFGLSSLLIIRLLEPWWSYIFSPLCGILVLWLMMLRREWRLPNVADVDYIQWRGRKSLKKETEQQQQQPKKKERYTVLSLWIVVIKQLTSKPAKMKWMPTRCFGRSVDPSTRQFEHETCGKNKIVILHLRESQSCLWMSADINYGLYIVKKEM